MAITEYGEFIRSLRKKRKETIEDSAKLFNVSVPFVSAVENGKKKVPQGWYHKIVKYYDLRIDEKKKLEKLILKSDKKITFYFEKYSSNKVDLMINLKNVLGVLDDQKVKEINIFLEQEMILLNKEIEIYKEEKNFNKDIKFTIKNNLDK